MKNTSLLLLSAIATLALITLAATQMISILVALGTLAFLLLCILSQNKQESSALATTQNRQWLN